VNADDTIVAISSVAAPGARIIVRTSGRDAIAIANSVCDALPHPGSARVARISFSNLTVPAWVYLFADGRSYTGEPSVEFHLPGNPLLARMLLDHLVASGARAAEAGEFTARAYFSGRLDLAEAEGVAATIAAHSEQELRAARQLLAGELSRRLRPMTHLLTDTLALLEVGIDFSDEDVTFLQPPELIDRIDRIDRDLDDLLRTSRRFEQLAHEPTFVLVGRPNAGKSTLLNVLAGHERAVVSPVAGTTRDVLSAEIRSRRGMIRLLDVAGLDDATPAGEGAAGEIERHMSDGARRAVETADRVIYVRACDDVSSPLDLPRPADLAVLTKSDLAPRPATAPAGSVVVSSVTGDGMDVLRARLDELAFGGEVGGGSGGGMLALNARHLRSIAGARGALARARTIASSAAGPELVALELREALDALGAVLGEVTPDDVLGRVFATFCIGK
jgi:tRNA modification GTPase